MSKIPFIIMTLVLLFYLFTGIAVAGESKWTEVNIPGGGRAGDYLLAPDTDILCLIQDNNGTLYAGSSDTIYRSNDGSHWETVAETGEPVIAIVTAPDDPDIIYYATADTVYRSTNGGEDFKELAGSPGNAGEANIAITALTVTVIDGNILAAAATRDDDTGEFGGVYLWNQAKIFDGWADTGLGDYDVYAVAFSPNFADDEQLVAVVTDETDTMVMTRSGDTDWGQTYGEAVLTDSGESIGTTGAAVIAFPDDYDADNEVYTQFVAIATGTGEGGAYLVIGRETPEPADVFPLLVGTDIKSLAVSGPAENARLLAGTGEGAIICFSPDAGETWTKSAKPPTGDTVTGLVLDNENELFYAATAGNGSAVSVSRDEGQTWNQYGLIDTEISNIIDLAPSPKYDEDETLFLLTWGGEYSLWRSEDGGETWERRFSSDFDEVDEIDHVALPPDYDGNNRTVFLAGSGVGQPVIWYSRNDGLEFTARPAPLIVDAWAVGEDKTLFIAGYDGSQGRVYRSANGGLSYSDGAVAGKQYPASIVLSPNYDADETILLGNSSGGVFISENNGKSFRLIPDNAETNPLTGVITVAFDPEFEDNRTVYAASDTKDSGVHRLRLDRDNDWTAIDDSLPEKSRLGQLQTGPEGCLYAANFLADGGLERCLQPSYSTDPTFETVTRGLDDGASLEGLWAVADRLWTIDTCHNRLLSYTDSLTEPAVLTSPADEAPEVGTVSGDTVIGVELDWLSLSGATGYQWQLDYETDLTSVPGDFEGDSQSSQARLPELDPATTYYWRVRAVAPVLSPWSEKWSFTTSLGNEVVAPRPNAPAGGADGIDLRPVFQWSSIAGAEGYELLLATDTSFENLAVANTGNYAIPATAWQCEVDLKPETAYFWKVRAVGNNSSSAWSDVYVFTTAVAPEIVSPETPIPGTNSPDPADGTETDWTKWLVIVGIALLVLMAAILVTMLVLIVRMRPY